MTLPEVAARAPLTKAAESVDEVYHKVPTQHIATARDIKRTRGYGIQPSPIASSKTRRRQSASKATTS